MINPLIREQLQAVKTVEIPPIDDNTTVIKIAKQVGDIPVIVSKYYLIELENYLINPPPNFDLHINWNKNIVPKDKYMNCQVLQIAGKMIKVSAVGVDESTNLPNNRTWEGWLPKKSIKVLKEL